jgi:uncharacterized membrane protein YvlD (DUF360 family)
MDLMRGLAALPLTIVTSVLLIFLGVVYFVVSMLIFWVIADLIQSGLDANWRMMASMLAAALVTVGSLVGAAMQQEATE